MSGKEEERFKGSEIDSLEEKLRKKKSKSDEQLEEVRLTAIHGAWRMHLINPVPCGTLALTLPGTPFITARALKACGRPALGGWVGGWVDPWCVCVCVRVLVSVHAAAVLTASGKVTRRALWPCGRKFWSACQLAGMFNSLPTAKCSRACTRGNRPPACRSERLPPVSDSSRLCCCRSRARWAIKTSRKCLASTRSARSRPRD